MDGEWRFEDGGDLVFKALADPTRRRLLDRLRVRDGQTLGELCAELDMARQSATQHVDQLVAADLVVLVRRGRQRLHYLNPVPIHDIQHRWIAPFDEARLAALRAIKHTAEEYAMTTTDPTDPSADASAPPTYVYVTYIHASAEQVWHALTDADLTARYWGHANVSDWQVGSTWVHQRTDGSGIDDVAGTVLEADPPHRLAITFNAPDADPGPQGPTVVTFVVEPGDGIVRLTVTHENLADEQALRDISQGWPAVCANLKSLLETGDVLPQAPWSM